MPSLGLLLVSLLLWGSTTANSDKVFGCGGPGKDEDVDCQQPLKPVTTVVPGSFYVAKIPCPDCPMIKTERTPGSMKQFVAHEENDLFLNITLSHDNRTLFVNEKPIFPSINTNPHPPQLFTHQVPPDFGRANLDTSIQCAEAPCTLNGQRCNCISPSFSGVILDFDYYSHWLESHPETQTEKWEITFDAIGGREGLQGPIHRYNSTEQYVLRIIMQGKEIEGERYAGEKDLQAASSLFGNLEESEALYEYGIASVEVMERRHVFQGPEKLGFWGRIRRFFGMDIMRDDGHVVYLQEEWGWYGKKGSIRNGLGTMIHEWPWQLVFIVIVSVIGGLFALWGVFKLFFLVKQQRELARWDGMDDVWERLRRDTVDEEEDRLLDGGYRDEPDEGSPPAYTDEVQTNKPLPSKPLPEKPLPAVPLIDA